MVKIEKIMTYFEFQKRFSTEEAALSYIIDKKFPNGVYVCHRCGSVGHKIYHQKHNAKLFCCNNCKSEFSVLHGTIFENTHLDLRMWLYAINLIVIWRKGVSVMGQRRALGMGSYGSAWRMMHRIREAISKDDTGFFKSIVEIDETYIGGNPRADKEHKRGRGTNKTPIIGIKERENNRVRAEVAVKNEAGKQLSGTQLYKILEKNCADNCVVMTDKFSGYNILDKTNGKNFSRKMVNHNDKFVVGDVHTNGIESFWALFKRGLHGTFHHVSIKYLQLYINEFCFRLNYRDNDVAFEKITALAVL
jgi:transposase-like protein